MFLKQYLSALRYEVRDFCGIYPSLFYATYGLKSINRSASVTPNTQLVIEGFPRSANSFAVFALQFVNPNIRLAHHLHVPAQIIQAVKWKVPTLVLVRNPKDAVASLCLRNPDCSLLRALKSYILFYQTIQSYQSNYVIGTFEDIIQDYSQVIKQVNDRFDTKFVLPSLSDTEQKTVLKQIQELDKLLSRNDPLKMAVPKAEKAPVKKKIFQELEFKHSKYLTEAENIYTHYIKAANLN
jgi:hypothetical protein